MKIVTRFAPSPTGLLHAGNYRTALFSYLFARQNGGKFLLRIEDTDRERSKKEYADNIIESLAWLGLEYDKLPDGRDHETQSNRLESHRKHLQTLIDKGFAYVSREERDGKITEPIRFKNPGAKVAFKDLIRGEIVVDTTDLKDFVIAKNINEPLFHLAVVVDDFEMGITHVIRGEDHISNTPRQILIARAIGAPEPVYAHLPLVLAPDRSKLSKRKGALAMTEYRDRGYLPEALLNYMALIGWNPGTEQEILSKQELIEQFKIDKIQKGGAIFNEEKLRWLNKEYLKKRPISLIEDSIRSVLPKEWQTDHGDAMVRKIAPIVLDRIETLGEIRTLKDTGELDYYFSWPAVDPAGIVWKKSTANKALTHLKVAMEKLEAIEEKDWSGASAKTALWDYAEREGRGDVLWPIRFSLSGREKSPDPFSLMDVLGKHETLARLKGAFQSLSTR